MVSARVLVTGNFHSLTISCSIAVPIRPQDGVFPPKYSLPGNLSYIGGAIEGEIFPVQCTLRDSIRSRSWRKYMCFTNQLWVYFERLPRYGFTTHPK